MKSSEIKNVLPDFVGSARILDIRNDKYKDSLLICGSTATCPGTIFTIKNGEIQQMSIAPIEGNPFHQNINDELESKVIELNSKVHIVLLKPRKDERMPLIIVPHGGPNSVYSVDYVLYPVILARLGYAVASSKTRGDIH